MRTSTRIIGATILVLLSLNMLLWYACRSVDRHGSLIVTFFNVGEGDSIFIQAPSGRTALIDGGPDSGVLRQVSSFLPWYMRSIDVVIPTHADADHITGLVDVLKRYRVGMVLQSDTPGTTPTWKTLENSILEAGGDGATVLAARRGQVIGLGEGAYLEVLSPDRSLPRVDTNTGCIVTRLVYGSTSFLFSCDAPQAIEQYLVHLDGHGLHADVLKAGHHGSKTSSSRTFVGYVDPAYVVFSRGCGNKYGFPSPETVATFKSFNIQALDTCASGNVTFVSDGSAVTKK